MLTFVLLVSFGLSLWVSYTYGQEDLNKYMIEKARFGNGIYVVSDHYGYVAKYKVEKIGKYNGEEVVTEDLEIFNQLQQLRGGNERD